MRRILLIGSLLLTHFSGLILAAPQAPSAKKDVKASAASAFEPLDRWKAAVLSGDRVTLARFYTTSPPARAKTPQGETQDPAEEPLFWSSLRAAGLSRLDVKVLEKKNIQPGVIAFVLRIELDVRTSAGMKSGIIGGAQVWVDQQGEWRIISTQRSDPGAKPAMRLPEPAKPNAQLYPEPEEAQSEIASALADAKRDGKRVLLVFGGNWCYDCHVLDETFRSRSFAPVINQNYHVVHINVGDFDKNVDLAEKYEIPLKKGVPSLAVIDQNGKLIVSQKKGEFESTLRIGPDDVLHFLRQWKPFRGGG